VELAPGFVPWRRNVEFLECVETPIKPLIDALSFVKDKQRWGFVFRLGLFEIPQRDFELIKHTMGAYGYPLSFPRNAGKSASRPRCSWQPPNRTLVTDHSVSPCHRSGAGRSRLTESLGVVGASPGDKDAPRG
jgi:hypothetical protein